MEEGVVGVSVGKGVCFLGCKSNLPRDQITERQRMSMGDWGVSNHLHNASGQIITTNPPTSPQMVVV